MNLSIKQKIIGALLAIVALLGGGYRAGVLGSIQTGEGYYATTTVDASWGSATVVKTLKIGPGMLGSIVVASTSPSLAPATLRCFDSSVSTTTASSTLAVIGKDAVAGTYTYDVSFNAGLKCDAPAGFTGAYTITYK